MDKNLGADPIGIRGPAFRTARPRGLASRGLPGLRDSPDREQHCVPALLSRTQRSFVAVDRSGSREHARSIRGQRLPHVAMAERYLVSRAGPGDEAENDSPENAAIFEL